MSRATTDMATVLKTLLSTNWTKGNTDSITPTFALITDVDNIDLANNDYVMTHEIDNSDEPGGIGTSYVDEKFIVRVDIRTGAANGMGLSSGKSHFTKVVNEVIRLIDSKIITVANGLDYIEKRNSKDLSDKSRRLWRKIIDVEMISISSTRA